MIIGLDHITLSSNDFDKPLSFLEELGFKIKFVERNLLNHEFKKEYLRQYSPLHEMAYLNGFKESPAIELIMHSKKDSGKRENSQKNLLISGNIGNNFVTNDSTEAKVLKSWLGGQVEIREIEFEPFGVNFYCSNTLETNPAKVHCMLLKVNNLDSALEFWVKALGFKIISKERDVEGIRWAELFFPSGIRAWQLKLLIVESSDHFSLSYLDDIGFTSVCFISTNITRDRDCLGAFPGVTISKIFELNISEKSLKICVGRAQNNELIELIQVGKNN